jgi:hypothetical protein
MLKNNGHNLRPPRIIIIIIIIIIIKITIIINFNLLAPEFYI